MTLMYVREHFSVSARGGHTRIKTLPLKNTQNRCFVSMILEGPYSIFVIMSAITPLCM